MLKTSQRPYTAAGTFTRRKSCHNNTFPPKSESGLLPLARPQTSLSVFGSLKSKIGNSRHHADSSSRPKTGGSLYRLDQQSVQTCPPRYLQLSHTPEWLSNRRVTHEEVLVPRIIDIPAISSLEETSLYSKYSRPSTKENRITEALELEDANRSFFYNEKRRQADFELMEQEMLAREEEYNSGKCASKGTLLALRKTAQMITCSIPVAPPSNTNAAESLRLSASPSQASVRATEKMPKAQVDESISFSVPHSANHQLFLTEVSKPALPSEVVPKSVWESQQTMPSSRLARTEVRQACLLPNNDAHVSAKDPTLHITSSVNLGAGSYNLSFASLRPLSRSQSGARVAMLPRNARRVSRFEAAHTASRLNINCLADSDPTQTIGDAPLVQYSPIPVTILDFFGS